MARILTDTEIAELLAKEKPLPGGWRSRLKLKDKTGDAHKKRDLDVEAATGEIFVIKCRQRKSNPLDFSIILLYMDEAGNEYRLMRCNGKHESEHTNWLERDAGAKDCSFAMEFHIHLATQRYQEVNRDEDSFAEPTSEYSDFETAIECFVKKAGCTDPDREPDPPLLSLMGGGK